MMTRFRDALSAVIRAQARCNGAVQAPPSCVLWPDKERHWQDVVPALQAAMPELYVLGSYAPDARTGPAIWLRCALDRTLPPEQNLEETRPLVFYLPGVSRGELRAIASCPVELAPLAELQYRGVIWSHPNGRDWTPFAFLASDKGLHLDLAEDTATKDALRNAMAVFLDEDLANLKGRVLDASYFHALVVESPERDLLAWLNDSRATEQQWSPQKREAFEKICKKQFRFSPAEQSGLDGVVLLAAAEGAWKGLWQDYADMPQRYPGIYDKLLAVSPPAQGMLIEDHSHYPKVNEQQEDALRTGLLAIEGMGRDAARDQLERLEKQHGERRSWLWAHLGHADLARVLAPLVELARLAAAGGGAVSLAGMRSAYESTHWRCDAAAVEAMALVRGQADKTAVNAVLRTIYLPWLDEHARLLQSFVFKAGNAYGEEVKDSARDGYAESDCILFVDGLRYDVGKRLAEKLKTYGTVTFSSRWSALPSITAVGKYAASPLAADMSGTLYEDEPVAATLDGKMITSSRLASLLAERGFQTLEGAGLGDPQGKAWDEHGDIDTKGHASGARLAREIETLLNDLIERIGELLQSGWKRIHVVTDHGWLLVPGGLPKVAMPPAFTLSKWGRTGVLASAAPANTLSYLWKLDSSVRLVSAPGAGSFIEGKEYSHGGVSMQENLLPDIIIEGRSSTEASPRVAIVSIRWTQLRCEIRVSGAPEGSRVDLRINAGNAASSIANQVKMVHGGAAVLIVPDEEKTGNAVHVVVLDATESIFAQETTTVGG